ncbi:hypothetical protein LguiA_027386 [Lonicera macranthoides]
MIGNNKSLCRNKQDITPELHIKQSVVNRNTSKTRLSPPPFNLFSSFSPK